MTLEGIDINAVFIRSHIIAINPEREEQFVTLSGAYGMFLVRYVCVSHLRALIITVHFRNGDEKYMHLIAPETPPAITFNPLIENVAFFRAAQCVLIVCEKELELVRERDLMCVCVW